MKKSLGALLVLMGLVSRVVNGAPAAPENPSRPGLPDNLKVPATEQIVLEATAQGVQIYECTAKKDQPTELEWTLKAPEAELYDSAGHPIGRHYQGPTWALKDGSQVVGEVIARAAAPDTQTIPWLLLKSKATTGQGRLSAVTYIQRVNTVGGQTPASGCDSTHVGYEQRIAYTATYNFYVTQP